MIATESHEWQVCVADAAGLFHRRVKGWTVFGATYAEAMATAELEQKRHGGSGSLCLLRMRPACAHCGFRHAVPPGHLATDSYCRVN